MKIIGYVLLGLLALLLLILLLPLGAELRFGEATQVRVCIGPLRLSPEKLASLKKKKQPPAQAEQPAKPAPPKEKKPCFPKPTVDEFFDLVGTALHALGGALRRLCRGVHLDPLQLSLTLGGRDPAALAKTCGYVNAALWTFMPQLEKIFTIPDPCIGVCADFQGGKTRAEGHVGVRLRPMTLVIMALVLAWSLFGWYRRFKKAHKNDPPPANDPKTAPQADGSTEKTEEKLSA